MILDGTLLFDSGVAVTATAVSTNVVDLVNPRDLGNDPEMKVELVVTAAMLSAGATTLQVQFQGSTDNSTYTTYAESPAIAKASLTAGARSLLPINLPSPGPGVALPRYLRLNYIVATGPFTAGNLTAFLVLDKQMNITYPPGIAIAN
jgi:hypothetical protein